MTEYSLHAEIKEWYSVQGDEVEVKVASAKDEIKALLEVGFEYICEKDELYYFRKRK